MKELAGVLLAATLLIGATVIAVARCDDRELMIPPPDAVAEQFVRAVVLKRFDQAKKYVAGSVEDSTLRALQQKIGDPMQIEAKLISRDDEHAIVTVNAMQFALVFEKGWKVEM